VRTIGVRLTADTSGYISGLARAGAATRDFTGQMDKAAKTGHLDKVADQATKFGIAGVAAFGLVVKSAADFDKQMSAVSAATHANTADMAALRAAALQAGKDTQFSATEAAKGITELSKAGVTTADVLGGGLKGALSLAAAGQIDVGQAAEVAASAMTQFKLKGDQIPHVADLLAAGAGKAQGSVQDMSAALNQSGLIAAQTGLTIEDTTGTLAAFASAGLTGSDAGTSFKTMLQALQAPSAKSAGLMKDLGVSAYDAQGNFVGITALAGQLKTQLGKLTPELRANALAQIFGSDATRAASVLYEQGAVGVQTWIDKTNDAGYASKTAALLTNNLAGDIERLKGSLETLAISSGSGANSGVRVLTKGLNGLVNQFLNLPPAVGSTVTVLAGVGGAAALGLVGFVKLRKGVAEAAAQLNSMGPAGEKAATGLGKVASVAGKAAAAFVVWQAAMAAANAFQDNTATNTEAMAVGLQKFSQGAQLSGEAARVLGGNLENLTTGFKYLADADNGRRKVVKGLQEALESAVTPLAGYAKSLTNTQAQIDAIDQSLASMVSAGNAPEAAATFERLSHVLAVNGVTVDEVKKKFPGYAAAVEKAGAATGKLSDAMNWVGPMSDKAKAAIDGAGSAVEGIVGPTGTAAAATKKYATAADAAADAARGESSALISLSNAMKAEVDPVFALLNAENAMAEAQKNASKAVREHGRNSVEAKDATRNLASAAIDLQGKAGALGATFDGKMTPAFRRTLTAAGLTDRQIQDVAKQFRQAKSDADKYDGKYVAHVSTTGVEVAAAKLSQLVVLQQALRKGVSMSAARALSGDAAAARDRGLFAEGGWTGPGTKHQPAGVVHADEFVVQKASRAPLEAAKPGALDYMNTTGRWPGYAGGGYVWPYPTTASRTRIPSKAEATAAVMPSFGNWPSSPGAQRGDSGVWRSIVALIKSTGPLSGSFGNAYRPGDPLWHGSGRAVDWMGFNQDRLATFLAARRPLELIHRTNRRDYAYTRGVNKGSFNNSLMQAHRNHVHIAMAGGGVINEPVAGVGASGRSYSFAERGTETVLPGVWHRADAGGAGGGPVTYVTVGSPVINVNGSSYSPQQIAAEVNRRLGAQIDQYARTGS